MKRKEVYDLTKHDPRIKKIKGLIAESRKKQGNGFFSGHYDLRKAARDSKKAFAKLYEAADLICDSQLPEGYSGQVVIVEVVRSMGCPDDVLIAMNRVFKSVRAAIRWTKHATNYRCQVSFDPSAFLMWPAVPENYPPGLEQVPLPV